MANTNTIHKQVERVDTWCHCENSKKNPQYDIDHTCLYCGHQEEGKDMPDSMMAAIKEYAKLMEES